MGNEVVKYHNDMNEISLGGFKEKELDLFFSICYKLNEQGTKEVKLKFSELKELIGENDNPKRVKTHIDSLNKKLAMLNHKIEIRPNVFELFVLFTNFTTDYNDNTLTIKVNDKFSYILNNIINRYTKFDLLDFISLKSTYSKNMFKLLKQWDSVKRVEYTVEELKSNLGVPKAYANSDFNKRVLNPIMEDLPKFFHNLDLEKIKSGRTITSYKFTWNSKKIEVKEAELVEIQISVELKKALDKAKKNRFIDKLITDDNVEILTDLFNETNLIKGLKYAYKEIKQEISSLNYLIKTIRSGIEEKEIKVSVKESNVIQELKFEEVSLFEEVKTATPIQISKEQYEELYNDYLKENKAKNTKNIRTAFDIMNQKKYEIVEVSSEKIYTVEELPKEKLLSKEGKELKGSALEMRLKKLAKELGITISYKERFF